MSTLSIGDVLAGVKPAKRARSFQPVRRNSYYANDRRSNVWRPIAGNNRDARRLISARLKAAEFYDRRNKEAGKKNGPLGHVGLEVLRELYRIVDFKTGRLEPAIETVCVRAARQDANCMRCANRRPPATTQRPLEVCQSESAASLSRTSVAE